ncbi:Zinc finger, SWIM-type [Sarocladium implicatum]|nr:Zinc finger, SWIM-type [Sarocladium implicatum]
MTPTTRSKALADRDSSPPSSSQEDEDEDHSSSCSDSDAESDTSTSTTVQSPSKLKYRIGHLSEARQSQIRDVFSDPPQLALQRCRLVNSTFAFQMTELVTRSVRIRAPDASGDGSSPLSCSCGDSSEGEPCKHLIWLLDRVAEQTLYEPSRGKPLNMTEAGYSEEMDDPFRTIADHDLEVLGPGLHCPVVGGSSSEGSGIDVHRVQEARELLAAVHNQSVDSFRPGLSGDVKDVTGSKVFKRGDLDTTILRMLVDNNHFFQYFFSAASRSNTHIKDPFRSISQRIDRILQALDDASSRSATSSSLSASQDARQQPVRGVAWASKHLLGCTTLVRSFIFSRSHPLSSIEAVSAAQVLTRLLALVVSRNLDTHHAPSGLSQPTTAAQPTPRSHRNLYLNLIGDRDRDFVIGMLALLPPAATSHFLDRLEACLEDIGTYGAPSGYVQRFRKLLERLRSSSASGRGTGMKRSGAQTGQESVNRDSKRMK